MVYKGLKSAAEKHRDKLERQKALEANLRAQQVSHSCCTCWGLPGRLGRVDRDLCGRSHALAFFVKTQCLAKSCHRIRPALGNTFMDSAADQ